MAKAPQKDFQSEFERIIRDRDDGGSLRTLLKRVQARGFGQDYVIWLLGTVTDRAFLKRLQRQWDTIQRDLPFTGKRLPGLAERTEHLARDLELTFGHKLLSPHPEAKRLLAFAASLRSEASKIRRFPKPKLGKVFSYRALHSHIPAALLCLGLRVGNKDNLGISFTDAERLLWYANFARGRHIEAADKSLKRGFGRFMKSAAGKLFLFTLATKLRYRRLAAAMS